MISKKKPYTPFPPPQPPSKVDLAQASGEAFLAPGARRKAAAADKATAQAAATAARAAERAAAHVAPSVRNWLIFSFILYNLYIIL